MLSPYLLIILACLSIALGILAVIRAAKQLQALLAGSAEPLPEPLRWSPASELSMAFILINAGCFFAVHCLRGLPAVLIATALILLAASCGSQFRYKQLLALHTTAQPLATQLARCHRGAAIAIALLFTPEIALVLFLLHHFGKI